MAKDGMAYHDYFLFLSLIELFCLLFYFGIENTTTFISLLGCQ